MPKPTLRHIVTTALDRLRLFEPLDPKKDILLIIGAFIVGLVALILHNLGGK